MIRDCDLFDGDWYVERYPDVKTLGIEPAEHYLWFGAQLERNPSRRFDTAGYIKKNPTTLTLGVNPLLHHLRTQNATAVTALQGRENELEQVRLAQHLYPTVLGFSEFARRLPDQRPAIMTACSNPFPF